MWNSGATVEELAYEFGTTMEGVYSYASRNRDVCNSRHGNKRRKLDNAALRRVYLACKAGASARDLASAYGVHHSTIRRYVKMYKNIAATETRDDGMQTVEDMLEDFAYAVDIFGNCPPEMISDLAGRLARKLTLR